MKNKTDFVIDAPYWYWQIPKTERDKGRCGPGRGFAEKLVPETIWGMSVTDCCQLHDKEYSRWNPLVMSSFELSNAAMRHISLRAAKKKADIRFMNNMLRKSDWYSANAFMRWLRQRRIYKMYFAVSEFGLDAFMEGVKKEV